MQLSFHNILIYLLSFIGLFTSIVYFLTIFSPNKKKYEPDPNYRPKVSIIVPIWNEGSAQGERLRKTINSLLNCTYPKDKLEIIIVNDGSTDNSLEIAKSYEVLGVKVLSRNKSQGKTKAINLGLKYATGELIAGLDADSFIEPDVLDKLVPCFKDKNVMGAIPSIKIWKPKRFLQKVQSQEFLSAVFIRHLQSELGAIPLAPGAFTLVRKSFIDKHGLLSSKTMVEDLELSLRIQSKNYLIENVIDANVYTSGVKTFKIFVNQRIRWFYGFLIQLKRYKHLFSKKYGNLGVFILPVSVIFVFLTVFVFFYSMIMIIYNSIKWIREIYLVGFQPTNLFEFNRDLFLIRIDNTTILPVLLLIVAFSFMLYIKAVSKERQGITLPFISFISSYWFLGSLCWILAIYYYIRKKKVKWGPNYFSS
ncbi:MAG: glycosyltransferase family 2 protein [Nanoarchaeota archaeon]|nr:glycosyltransferase family 2 protein [Nanoarchaeota archaeon]MBU1269321.1 glycosyltransferase family 2 protein [Nanoarchaeota archaeon]MBU1604484.1 glycosyltransferase family 2 protein [Nanoarchaeota archaeon]MBU2443197.1 glycosyltransferase family 2 protein [Nanoarchaeota archaeon]